MAGQDPESIDRYRVRRRLSTGAMGVVYVAHDPDLEREVAIKMLPRGVDGARLRREAKALARLSHPNVVAVHDVGEHEGQVFVAMTLVDGVTLRQWLVTPHTSSEILRVVCDAGRGIVAAHAAGLIHRDLKPDNIFVATSGEVLVGDFGLARDAAHDSLATEQSDQLSFCVMAHEALFGTTAAPARNQRVDASVERALRRGMRADPAERFGSMSELLRAIQPRARRWPWLAAIGLAVVGAAVATAFVVRRDPVADADAICASAGAPVWNPLMRGALEAALLAQGNTRDATVELGQRLDRYAATWTSVRRDACLDQLAGRLTPVQATGRIACLDTRKTMFEVTTASLVSSGADVFATWKRVAMIPPPATCNSDDAARLSSATPEHQALMRALASAVNRDTTAIAEIVRKAETTTDVPARLEIALAQAVDALNDTRLLDADAALARARPLAEQLDVLSMRVRAFALSARSFCIQARTAEADRFLTMALAGAQRLRESEHESEIDEVFQARSECLYRRARYAELEPLLVERIALVQRRYGRDGLEEANLRQRLALLYIQIDRPNDSAREYDLARRIEMRFVRTDENAARQENDLSIDALQKGDLDGSISHARRAIQLLHALDPVALARSYVSLGTLLDTAADLKGSEAAFTQALERLAPETTDEDLAAKRLEALESRGWVRLQLGSLDPAITDLQATIVGAERFGRADYLTSAQIALGRAWVAKGEYERAVRVLGAWLEPYKKSVNRSTHRVGTAQFDYAQALWATGARDTARTLGREAQATITEGLERRRKNPIARNLVPSTEAYLAGVDRWRDAHR